MSVGSKPNVREDQRTVYDSDKMIFDDEEMNEFARGGMRKGG